MTTEILWDKWGIPHLFAERTEDIFYALAWSQMSIHSELIIKLYAQSSGKACSCWGINEWEIDRKVSVLQIPRLANEHYEQQSIKMKKFLLAFVKGINDYADAHPDKLSASARRFLPVSPLHVLAHLIRVIHFTFVPFAADIQSKTSAGSNAWAIAPKNTRNGKPILLIDPHLPWKDLYLCFDAHLYCEGVIDFYGNTLVGIPLMVMGTSKHLGWAHTVNTAPVAELIKFDINSAQQSQELISHQEFIDVIAPSEEIKSQSITVSFYKNLPVVSSLNGEGYALKIPALQHCTQALEQWWEMSVARDITVFKSVIDRQQIPIFNIIYADKDGEIGYWFNAAIEKEEGQLYSMVELPHLINPPSGWLQNANDPPWSCSLPNGIEPKNYQNGIAPKDPIGWRAQHSIRLLSEKTDWTLEDIIVSKHSTESELARRLVPKLIEHTRQQNLSKNSLLERACLVLEKWDLQCHADSIGAVLFQKWVEKVSPIPFQTEWSAEQPLTTPAGLASEPKIVSALYAAAEEIELSFTQGLQISWGDVYRLQIDKLDAPASGGYSGGLRGIDLGILRSFHFSKVANTPEQHSVEFGDCFVLAVEYSQPIRAYSLLAYRRDPDTRKVNSLSWQHLINNQLHPVYWERAEVETHLYLKIQLGKIS